LDQGFVEEDMLAETMAGLEFISYLLRLTEENPNIGYLFDVPHAILAAETMAHIGRFGKPQDYLNQLIDLVAERTHEVHSSSPIFEEGFGYIDWHMPFIREDGPGEITRRMTKKVVDRTQPEYITLEILTSGTPVEHAELLAQQIEETRDYLGL
jgi:hypothetical protein